MKDDSKPKIRILGLGPGDPRHLTREAWSVLQEASEVHLRTRQHPTTDGFPEHLRVFSFDDYYENGLSFPEIYQRIVERVMELGRRPEGVLYGVPGDPWVAEATTPAIIERAQSQGIPYRVISGLSFLEPVFAVLQTDPLPQTTVVDALEVADLHHPPFPPDVPALVAQVYSPQVASHLKLTLNVVYPDHHPVLLIHGAGTLDQRVEDIHLYQMDRSQNIGNLTCLYLPPLPGGTSLESFQEVIAHLRAPDGCPWDREQTHQSLRPHLLEEAYEVLAALDQQDPEAMQEEFGDLLLQIVLHAQIGAEFGEFTMADILQSVNTKIVSRHPHVFQDLDLDQPEQVTQNWERIKAQERVEKGDALGGLLQGIAPALPALSQAQTIQKRVKRVGFDWPDKKGVVNKIQEELQELDQAQSIQERVHELGDVIFSLVNLARWYQVDAESALREANQRFQERFHRLEGWVNAEKRQLEDLSVEELNELWEKAKQDHLEDR